jgi:hypothetical protein
MASTVTARLSTAAFATESREVPIITYDAGLLEALRHFAQAAFDADHQPVLGLLLGRRTPHGAIISAWLPAQSLNTGRDANLARAAELARLEFPGEYPIGWFRSKHQGEPRLAAEEIQSAGHVIPGRVPLALVLRPSSQRPLRVAAYFPLPGASHTMERPLQEFFVHPGQEQPLAARSAQWVPSAHPASPVASGAPANRFQASLEGLRWAFPAGLLVVVALAGMSIAQWQSDAPVLPLTVAANSAAPIEVQASAPPLGVSSRGKQWILTWAPEKNVGAAALLVTLDGRTQTVDLDPSQYEAGSYPLTQRNGDVEIALRTQRANHEAVEIRTRVVGTATTRPAAPAERRLSGELDRLKLELQAERNRRQLLQEMVAAQNAGR